MHVHSVRRNGRAYHYHRLTGERLPEQAAARAARVLAINAGLAAPAGETRRGTFAELIARFQAAPEFTALAPETRRGYARHLEAIGRAWGALPVAALARRNVRVMRDGLAERTSRAADYRVTVLKRLVAYGIDCDERLYGTDNPAAGLGRVHRGDGYKAWPDNVVEEFRRAAPPALARVALGGILGTGQRAQDAVALSWSHLERGGVLVVQRKTRTRLWLPMTRDLARAVAEAPRQAAVIFTTPGGRPWGLGHLRHEVARVLAKIGHPGFGAHGLRIKAASRLYEAGCEWEDIAAVLGHRTTEMVRHYTRQADRAKRAVARMEGRSPSTRAQDEG